MAQGERVDGRCPPEPALIDNPFPDEAWLSRAEPEAVLEPDLPIIDAHHHLWATPWPYGGPDYLADAATGHCVTHSICVEAGSFYRTIGPHHLRSAGEVEAFRTAAEAAAPGKVRLAAAIVGAADLSLPDDLGPTLDALAAAGGERFRGIRYMAASHPEPAFRGRIASRPAGMLRQPGVARSVAMLGERGLVFETWLFHEQLDELASLAAECPSVTIVLDHLGGPLALGRYREEAARTGQEWRAGLTRLAARSNVRLKLGGLGMVALGARFRERATPPSSETLAQAWGPRIRTAIDLFGPERCMFESNFPVDRGQTTWVALWNAFKRIVADRPQSARRELFADVARRTYRLANL